MSPRRAVSAATGGPWTPKFQPLFRRAGVDMDDAANKVFVAGHHGPHPQEYHEYVYNALLRATKGKVGDEYTRAFKVRLASLKVQCATPGTYLNGLLTY